MLSVGGTFTRVITSVTAHNQGSIAVSNCIQEPACDHRPAHPRLSCQQAHTCVLYVPLATGPGFTGPYNWASGALALRPDPYVAFGMTPTPPSGRRLVSQAVSPDSCSGLAHSAASKQCSVVDDVVSQKQGCGAPGADRILLQTTTTPISSSGGASIQGQVDAKEIGASNLTSSTGGIRSSDQAWVDKTGAIAVVGQVRSGDVPPNRPLSLLQVCSFLPAYACRGCAQGHVLQTLQHQRVQSRSSQSPLFADVHLCNGSTAIHFRNCSWCVQCLQVPQELVPEWRTKDTETQQAAPKSIPPWVRTAVIAGGAGGGGLLLGGLALCCLCAACKRRRTQQRAVDLHQVDGRWLGEAGSDGPGVNPRQGRREGEARDRPQRQKPAVHGGRSWFGTAEDRGRRGRDWEGSHSPGSPGDERRRYRAEQEGRRKGSKHSRDPREYGRSPAKDPKPWAGAGSPREPGAGFFQEVSHDGSGAPHLLIPASRPTSTMDGPSRWDGGSAGGPSPSGRPYREHGRGDRYGAMPTRSAQLPGPYPDEDGDERWLPGTPENHR
jgi:hypothetical protein